MMAALWAGGLAFLKTNLLKFLLMLVAAGTVAAVLLKAKDAGRTQERLEQATQAMKVKNAQLRSAQGRPRSRGELTGRLRSGQF